MKAQLLIAAIAIALSTTACSKSTSSSSSRSSSKSYSKNYSKPAVRPAYRSSKTELVHKPIKPKRRSVITKQEEIEFFPYNDCTRHVSAKLNGYKCIDRD